MRKISEFLVFLYKKFNSLQVLIGSFIAFTVIVGAMTITAEIMMPGDSITTFNLEFSTSAAEFLALANQLGPDAVNGYKTVLLIDCLFPFAYVVFICSIIALLASRKDKEISDTALFFFSLPLLGGILDLIENNTHLFLLGDLTRVTDGLVMFSTIVSAVKWTLPVIATLYIAVTLYKVAMDESFLPKTRRILAKQKKLL